MSSSTFGNFIPAIAPVRVDTNAAEMRAFSGARPFSDPKRAADKPSKSDRDMADPTTAVA